MKYLYEPSNICLTYGSIISFMFDEDKKNKAQIIPDLSESQNLGYAKNSLNLRKEEFSDILISREFLYSQGVFNEFCFFHNFKDKNELKYNYYNTLFLVLPKGEYESITKLRTLQKRLKKEILIDDDLEIRRQQINMYYEKFKQEIYSNQEYAIKTLTSKEKFVNYNDSVQFMHIKSGKILEFKKNNESLKIHIQLSDTFSENTIFHFIPAFNYQGENSAKVMINVVVKIACGEKQFSTENEKYLSKREQINKSLIEGLNSNITAKNIAPKTRALSFGKEILFKALKKVEDVRSKAIDKVFKARDSIRFAVNDEKTHEEIKNNFKVYINTSDISFIDFGKKILPNEEETIIAGNKSSNFWRILNFSKNFIEDNDYINSLDFFCIQNYEKNLYIQSIDCTNEQNRQKKEYNLESINLNNLPNEEDSSEILRNEEINRPSINIDNKTHYVRETNQTYDSTIKLNYFYENEFNFDSYYDLVVNSFEENDYIEPLSLFKFEVVYNIGNYGLFQENPKYTIDIIKDNSFVRLINVFTNKVLLIEEIIKKSKGEDKYQQNYTTQEKIYKLKLVNNQEISNKDYFKSVFIIEKVQDYEELFNDDNKNKENNNFNSNKKSKKNKKKKKEKNLMINKNEYIKIRSKKYNKYLGINLNTEQNKRSLVLTNSISDLTKFKLNCLDDIDKYEVHFFEQLIWSFENIINYFKLEEKNFSDNSISFNNYSNYEKIQHILIILEKRINNFPENNKVKISQKNKFDFMKAIEHFDVVNKLIDIFLANWFHGIENLNYYELEKKLEKYFGELKKEELNIGKYKKLISKRIFKILKIIYNLNRSYLNVIVDKLLYFFMFVGRDDKCTKFLIYILKNNGTLIISLCPLYNIKQKEDDMPAYNSIYNQKNLFSYNNNNQYQYNINNNINNINNNQNNINNINNINNQIRNEEKQDKYKYFKHCLKRIIKTYNSIDFVQLKINFSSVLLLFKLFNCLLIYNHKPFKQFYDEYFKDLDLLTTVNGEVSPNYKNNPILVEFFLKNNNIFIKKRKFFNKKKPPKLKKSFLNSLLKPKEEEEEIYEGIDNKKSKTDDEFEFELSKLIDINTEKDALNKYSAIILSKLVSINLIFYSHLSLCSNEFNLALQKIFSFDNIIKNYLDDGNNDLNNIRYSYNMKNEKIKSYNIANDLKCSLTYLLNYLYFHISFPFMGKMDLFYCLDQYNLKNRISSLHTSIVHRIKPKRINQDILKKIVDYSSKLIKESTNPDILLNIEPFFLVQILECTKYSLRNLYTYKNDEEKINQSICLISLILLLLENYIGLSETRDNFTNNNILDCLNKIKNDSLDTEDKLYLISDKSKLIFEKKRKKLEKIIKSKENISKKKLFKELFLIFISQKEEKNFVLDYESYKYRQRTLDKLRDYELSHILLETSISRNNDHKVIIDDILFLISDIFLEFLQYIENLEIEKVYGKINEIVSKNKIKKDEKQSEDEFYDILINSLVRESPDVEVNKKTNIYLQKVIEQYYTEKNISIDDKKDYKNISFFFFKFLQIIDNKELKKEILEILYKENSQKKIFYENLTNIVLIDNNVVYNKLLYLKDLFINIINTIHGINLIKRLDNNSFSLFEELKIEFENLINFLLDENKWRRENNIFNVFGNINYNENQKEDNLDLVRKKSIFNSNISNGQNININQYFLSEFSKEKVNVTQQTLFNLGFVDIINQIFEYISWVVNIKDDFNNELCCLEKILISIYKLLVVFIFDNKKHQFIIKEKLNLYLCSLKLKNKSKNILYFIGYFLLNVVYFVESQDEFNQIKNLDNVMDSLSVLQHLDWKKNKEIIPFYVQSFKIIISFCNYEYLYPVLKNITEVLVKEIYKNTDTNDDLLSLVKILELILNEQVKKCNDNKNTSILYLDQIIGFLHMIDLIKQNTINKYMKLSQIFIIITNLLYNHIDLYKNDFEIEKQYSNELKEILINFNENFVLSEDLIYCNKNKNNANLRYFNEFIGISIPKLYIILSKLNKNRYNKDDSLNKIKILPRMLYDNIEKKLINDQNEKFFVTKKNVKEVEEISKNVDIDSLTTIIRNIKERKWKLKLSVPKLIKSLITRKNLINKLLINDEYNPESITYIWNSIKERVIYKNGLYCFQNYSKYEINIERMNYIIYLGNFFDAICKTKEEKEENHEKKKR